MKHRQCLFLLLLALICVQASWARPSKAPLIDHIKQAGQQLKDFISQGPSEPTRNADDAPYSHDTDRYEPHGPKGSYGREDRQPYGEGEGYEPHDGPKGPYGKDGYEQDHPRQYKPRPEEPDTDSYKPHPEEPEVPYPPQKPPVEAPEGCPSPQPASGVKQAYLAHGSFIWRDLGSKSVSVQKSIVASSSGLKTAQPLVPGYPAIPVAPKQRILAGRSSKTTQDSSASPVSTASVSTAAVRAPAFLKAFSRGEAEKGFFGTTDVRAAPTDEAIAVGPHPRDADLDMILHGVNGAFEIFFSGKDGQKVDSPWPTKVLLEDLMAVTGLQGVSEFTPANPSAWYDCEAKRYVIVWATYASSEASTSISAPIFVAVSEDLNPLGSWTVWALDAVPPGIPGAPFCADGPYEAFQPDHLQASYSKDGIFISIGAYCNPTSTELFSSTLFVYSKDALYGIPKPGASGIEIFAAAYFARTSWYHSVPVETSSVVADDAKPFNNHITPVRPQTKKDLENPPLFVMKVDDCYMSIATLTPEPLDKMCDVASAPKILATVVAKGADFSTTEPGKTIQQSNVVALDAGHVGMAGRNYAVRSYGAVQHDGLVWLTTSEYFTTRNKNLASIYWGAFHASHDLCHVTRKDWGVVASEDGLTLSYPVIAANPEARGGALVAFSYSGGKDLPGGLEPAFPGVATAFVGRDIEQGPESERTIDVIKRGPMALTAWDVTSSTQRWGSYSAAAFLEDRVWFAVPVTQAVEVNGVKKGEYGSWISVATL